jgi:hypothetical protein
LPLGLFVELVHEFAEVEAALPEVAERIRRFCRTREGLFLELSLRREIYLDDVPELREAWSRSGVVLECQCPGGRDVEIDARGVFVQRPLDDEPDTAGSRR